MRARTRRTAVRKRSAASRRTFAGSAADARPDPIVATLFIVCAASAESKGPFLGTPRPIPSASRLPPLRARLGRAAEAPRKGANLRLAAGIPKAGGARPLSHHRRRLRRSPSKTAARPALSSGDENRVIGFGGFCRLSTPAEQRRRRGKGSAGVLSPLDAGRDAGGRLERFRTAGAVGRKQAAAFPRRGGIVRRRGGRITLGRPKSGCFHPPTGPPEVRAPPPSRPRFPCGESTPAESGFSPIRRGNQANGRRPPVPRFSAWRQSKASPQEAFGSASRTATELNALERPGR